MPRGGVKATRRVVSRETAVERWPDSFPDAEIAENHIQNILDIDPACQPAQGRCRRPQFLSDQFFLPNGLVQGAIQRRSGSLQAFAVPHTSYDARFRPNEVFACENG